MKFHDGAKVEGSWLDGRLTGLGKMTYPNGDTYDGEWLNN